MLVFSTRLPIRAEVTQQECLELFLEWLNGSPYYPTDEICFDVNSHDDYDYTKENITFSVRYFKDESIELSACRLENREANAIWDNDCVFLNDHGKKVCLFS